MTPREVLEKLADRVNIEGSVEKRQVDQALSDLSEIVMAEKANNPYPEKVFTEPTAEEYKLCHRILKENGLTIDKFSAAMGRRTFNNAIDHISSLFTDKEEK